MPERGVYREGSTTTYKNKRGMENRIVTFRCNTTLHDRLVEYALSTDRDPSECIREAIGEYLRSRRPVGAPTPEIQPQADLSGWLAKSKNI
jgi:hypothetical protein